MAALDAMELLGGDLAIGPGEAGAAKDDAAVLGVNVDLVAREAGELGGQHEVGCGLVQIHRRRPAGRVGAHQMSELFVEREEVAQRIPARERHVFIVARLVERKPYVLRLQGYTATNMPFVQATRLRKGMLIKVGTDLMRILELHHLTPGNKRAHIQVRMRNIRTLALADHKFRAEEDVERATLDEREMQYLYNDGDSFYFMDTSSYEQVHITSEALGDSKDYLIAEMTIRVEFYDVEPVGIELPPTVDLVVKETVPGIKGATASNQIKPATLETGLIINVPPFVNEGDKVRVNTETGEYQSRV
jgi:elongation factor P